MNITVNTSKLAVELRLLNKIVPNNPAIQILGYVKLEASAKLNLFATDLEIGLSASITAEVKEQGIMVVPAQKFLQMVERFPDGDMSLVGTGNDLTVKCGTFVTKMKVPYAEEFPEPPQVEGESLTLDAAGLRRLIFKTTNATAKNGSKTILQAGLLSMRDDSAAMIATDAKRLAMATMLRKGKPAEIVLPKKTMDAVYQQIDKGEITLTVGPRHLFFESEGRLLTSRTIDGEFPKWDRVIPREQNIQIALDRVSLIGALRRVELAAGESRTVNFIVKPGRLTLTAASVDDGTATEEMAINYNGEPIQVGMKSEHVLDFLSVAAQPTITMFLKAGETRALFSDGADYVTVIMLSRE